MIGVDATTYKSVVLDTSALMADYEILDKLINSYKIVLSIVTIEELDHLKTKSDMDAAFNARSAIRQIKKYRDNIEFNLDRNVHDAFKLGSNEFNLNDDIIVSTAYNTNSYLITNDFNLEIKASAIGVKTIKVYSSTKEYKGFKEIVMDNDEMAYFYSNLTENKYNMSINEYLVIKDSNSDVVDVFKWNGITMLPIEFRQINNDFCGNIKPANTLQELAFDMLQNNEITIKLLTGDFGTGKDFLMTSHAIHLLHKKKYDKIVWVRNNIEVKNSMPIGFLPNGKEDKLLPFAMVLADHLGGIEGLNMFMQQGKIEIEHLGFIRGRDIKNSIIMVSEAENMTKEHIQLLISRVGEGSSLWINGDIKQVDKKVFEDNNGIQKLIKSLKGQNKFGFVRLSDIERSETARLSSLLD